MGKIIFAMLYKKADNDNSEYGKEELNIINIVSIFLLIL